MIKKKIFYHWNLFCHCTLYPVDTALSGEEALRKILKNDYGLIILDVQMPGMDGFEVAENYFRVQQSTRMYPSFSSARLTQIKNLSPKGIVQAP
ncbi:MAG: response regulator [Bacteroidota bacterium]